MSDPHPYPISWRTRLGVPDPQAMLPVDLSEERQLSRIAVRVPALDEPERDDERDLLSWRSGSDSKLLQVEWIIDEFLMLEDDSVDRLRTMAKRWGPLTNPREEPKRAPIDGVWTESTDAWRDQAHLLQVVLALAANLMAGRSTGPGEWSEPLIRLGLINPAETATEFAEAIDVRGVFLALAGITLSQEERSAIVREMASALLGQSGVRVDSGVGVRPGGGQYVTLIGEWAESASASPPDDFLVLEGIRPILAIQAVSAIRDQRIYQCGGCGKMVPIAPEAPRPRTGVTFFGNHDQCRHMARMASRREAQRRYYRRSKGKGDYQ